MTSNPTDEAVRGVAAKLTPMQAKVIMAWGSADPVYHWSVANLIAKGLLDYRRRWYVLGPKSVFITRLGLAVKAQLEAGE